MRLLAAFLLLFPWVAGAIDLNNPIEAERELGELVGAWEKKHLENPTSETRRNLGQSLQVLGVIQRQSGKAAEAETSLTRAVDLLEDGNRADAQEALALTYQDLGKLAAAESVLASVLSKRRTETNEPVLLAITLDHFALNLLQQGRYSEVAPVLEEAISLLPDEARGLNAQFQSHLGRLHHTLGSHSRAIKAFDEGLSLAPARSELALSLRSQRALSLIRLGQIEEGSKETEEVARAAREIFAANPIKALPFLNNIGWLALQNGNIEEAVQVFGESVEIAIGTLGEDHPSLATPFNNLGVAWQMAGDYEEASQALDQSLRILLENGKDTHHLRVAEVLRNQARNSLLADDGEARARVDSAVASGLNVLEALASSGTERERLNFLERFDLISLPCNTGDAGMIANVLLASKSRLLDAMLGNSQSTAMPTWEQVQSRLPDGCAYIDACRYTPLNPMEQPRYGAIVLLPEGTPSWVELGPERDLIDWLQSLKDRVSWQSAQLAGMPTKAPAAKMQSSLKGLFNQFWKPLEVELSSTTHSVAFSPDGALHFLPLAALLDANGSPLSHRFRQICSVASGRALVAEGPRRSLTSSPWTVMTVSDFPVSEAPDNIGDLAEVLATLKPMPGTVTEAKLLSKEAPKGSSFLSGRDATETALRSLPNPPAVLHLGCHAFYTGPEKASASVALDFDESAHLLRSSGLVLYHGADAAVLRPAAEDDLLFPSEIAKLPLQGTRLVTLSSCESGAGTPVGGEGLLGLHRAFALAGADEVAVALWPVSDQSTPDFMAHFYRLATQSDRPAQALWQTQSQFIPLASDPDFETAVLRYAPFNLSQNGPLLVGPKIELIESKSTRTWSLWVIGLGLLIVIRAIIHKFLRARPPTE